MTVNSFDFFSKEIFFNPASREYIERAVGEGFVVTPAGVVVTRELHELLLERVQAAAACQRSVQPSREYIELAGRGGFVLTPAGVVVTRELHELLLERVQGAAACQRSVQPQQQPQEQDTMFEVE